MNGKDSPITILIDCGGSALRVAISTGGAIGDALIAPRVDGEELATAEQLVNNLLASTNQTPNALSIAVPGVVDENNNALLSAHGKYESLQGVNLKQWAETRWPVPFFIENDARAALLGETTSGVAEGAENAVAVILGTGIGTAALVNGSLVRGHTGHGGILGGHLTVDINQGLCRCGNRGCAESLASTWALAETHTGSAAKGIRELTDAARAGDNGQAAVLEHYLKVWGATIVSLCHLFDPEIVVLTGAPMKSADILLPALTDYVDSHLWSSLVTPKIAVAADPDMSVFRGLAHLAFRGLQGGLTV